MGNIMGKFQKGLQEFGGFGPAVKGFSGLEFNSSPDTEGIHTWLAELYGAFSLVVQSFPNAFRLIADVDSCP